MRAWSRTRWSPSPIQPADTGVIEDNLIFWNNFDYYRPSSPVRTVSGGVGTEQANYPIGAGVILFGTTNWTVKDNSIFGNFLWGVAAFSDPTNTTGKALNTGNHIMNNKMGAAFKDANGFDFFNDGSGKGTCFQNNGANVTEDVEGPHGVSSCTRRARTPTAPAPPRATRISSRSWRRGPVESADQAGDVLACPQAPGAPGSQALRGLRGSLRMKHKGLITLIACVAVSAVGVPAALGTTPRRSRWSRTSRSGTTSTRRRR